MNRGKKISGCLLVIVAFFAMLIISGKSNVLAAEQKSIRQLDVSVDNIVETYTGKEIKPTVTIYDGTKKLKQNTDYVLTYSDNKNPGKGIVTVTGKGSYKGTVKKRFCIAPQKTQIKSVIFYKALTGAKITWEKVNNATGYIVYMSEEKDGEYTCIRRIADNSVTSCSRFQLDPNKTYWFKVKTYTLYNDKLLNKKVTIHKDFSNPKTNTATAITKLNISLTGTIYSYTGGERRAGVIIYDGDTQLKRNKDYILTYENNVNTGLAQVNIRGIYNYKGTTLRRYYIAPQRAKITSVTSSGYGKATISWNKIDNASGYRIYMSESENGEYTRIKTFESNWYTSYTKSGLDPNKTYWFKVRAYVQVGDKRICKLYSYPKSTTALLASITLTSPNSGSNRNYNLWLACSRLNGKILNPGETFDWFKDHGPASAERGYKQAIVYQGTQSVLGYGGGVCQVSTTIYQAARDAGLEIVERHIHNKPVSYTTWGNDATVYYGVQNLRIRNNRSGRIKFVMYANGGSTTCQIYSI